MPLLSGLTDSVLECDLVENWLVQTLRATPEVDEFVAGRIYNQLVDEEAPRPYALLIFLEGMDDLAGGLRRLRTVFRYRVSLIADGRSFARLSAPVQAMDAALDAQAAELVNARLTSTRIGLWSYADKVLGRETVERGADYRLSIQRRGTPSQRTLVTTAFA